MSAATAPDTTPAAVATTTSTTLPPSVCNRRPGKPPQPRAPSTASLLPFRPPPKTPSFMIESRSRNSPSFTSMFQSRLSSTYTMPSPPSPAPAPEAALPPFRAPPLTPRFMIQSRRGKSTQAPPPSPSLSPAQKQQRAPFANRGIPTPLSPQELPAKYKSAERKVRTAIVALPIAIVTSWVLYNRLIKGEERKTLPRLE
ncbi:hypothetical protein FN846DRAFT_904893 [Sphaerosporella brunnea]|uniref:Uncharacterized protein n=1 Tax=Sphaerosporella brunnea TaxID=1250544 RepID=A0A5J5EFJ1_9PEZI|nr:hypothetical protein FN846DRAFT_913404 [Sphaerosporella brunnea]KAA8901917.1 hypothetical protein FN846DRAFT_987272 [Sphaerosporella brunnea]KAA8906309.1 hypothetical protein FN846DRAFT_907098 [Sphaerosporella brunnea]KAA8910642.1 hypothetical protein FN846DRAFT_904893 [Sphaerosporella brunnea]